MFSKSASNLTPLVLPTLLLFPVLLALLLFPADYAQASDSINLGPLLYIERDREKGTYELNALGPFISFKRGKHEEEYGFRPVFYSYKDYKKDRTSFDFLYPLSTHRTFEGDTKFQMLMYIFYYKSELRPSGFREKEFTLIPFIFARHAEDPERSHFAFFPFFGSLKQKYGKDEINFFMFPIFLQTKKDGVTNDNVLWPFFGGYSGEGVSGGRFWPLYGFRKKPGVFRETFALWPVYLQREAEYFGVHASIKAVLPFYYGVDMPGRKQRSYLWPFFNTIENTAKGYKRWDMPWFFVTITRGSVHTNRIWPLYSKRTEEGYETGFLLWPLYKYKYTEFGRHRQIKRTFALFIYKDTQEIAKEQGGKSGRTIHFWPLFSFKSTTGGAAYFRLISPLEIFLPNNEPRERNWAPLWRIFVWERDEEGNEVSSLLWNTFRTERTKESTKLELRPIIPLISIEKGEERSKFSLLGGLLEYSRDSVKKTFRFLYIPVNIYSGKESADTTTPTETMVLGDV